jgi:hypothetical protein
MAQVPMVQYTCAFLPDENSNMQVFRSRYHYCIATAVVADVFAELRVAVRGIKIRPLTEVFTFIRN